MWGLSKSNAFLFRFGCSSVTNPLIIELGCARRTDRSTKALPMKLTATPFCVKNN